MMEVVVRAVAKAVEKVAAVTEAVMETAAAKTVDTVVMVAGLEVG